MTSLFQKAGKVPSSFRTILVQNKPHLWKTVKLVFKKKFWDYVVKSYFQINYKRKFSKI